ncbi:MAG: capsule assembly Wzi family protein [Leadbetterella sp.]|nr:capsule assembly Wzi family protein [Leadbetterella sp.]
MKNILLIILVFILNFEILGQDFWVKARKKVFVGATSSTSGTNPFWLRSNVYGTAPLESNYVSLGGTIANDYDSTYTLAKKLKKFNWGYGVDAQANLGAENRFYLPEIYGKVRYGAFELYVGKRKEIFGLIDSTLSSGSFSWSGNAIPLPKIQISIPNYANIDKKGLFSIKGGYAHGYFDNNRQYTRNVKLHQKWMYLKLGKTSWNVNLFTGFNHQVMWGGQSPFFSKNGQLPEGFQNYMHVVLGTRGAISDEESGFFDENRIGNHVGSVDVGLSIKSNFGNIDIYRQSFYEDGSLFYLLNIKDGLNGISLRPKLKGINKICIEYLNTTDQGGDVFIIDNEYLRGKDSYYINGQYNDGYANSGKIMGTPFIQIDPLNYSKDKKISSIFLNNNRVKLIHLAAEGQVNNLSYSLKMSMSNNLGMYQKLISKSQFSLANLLHYRLNKQKFITDISILSGLDVGKYYPNSFGSSIKLIKSF